MPWIPLTHTHCYYTGVHAHEYLGFKPIAGEAGVLAAILALRAHTSLVVIFRLVPAIEALALFLIADAYDLTALGGLGAAMSIAAFVYALLPPPTALPAQPALAPPLVTGGAPVLGHLLDFIKGPVGMIDELRSRYRSMFTITVGPQRITFMIGAGPQLAFIKAKDDVLDQAPVYGFTIPVFGEGIVYDSPLDERQQQVKLLVHSMNTKGLEAMVPKMITEAEVCLANRTEPFTRSATAACPYAHVHRSHGLGATYSSLRTTSRRGATRAPSSCAKSSPSSSS